jgi:hypothetical protein
MSQVDEAITTTTPRVTEKMVSRAGAKFSERCAAVDRGMFK